MPTSKEYFVEEHAKTNFEDLTFESMDGTLLHARLYQRSTRTPKLGTVVFFHGNAENLTSHAIIVDWMREYGLNVLIFDYRGYGQSKGSPSSKGCHLDGLAALLKARSIHEKLGGRHFIVYGQSLGGIILLRAFIDSSIRKDIDLLVVDSSFASYKDIAFRRANDNLFTALFSPLAYALVSDKMSIKKSLNEIDVPLLVIHSKEDKVIPIDFGKEIYDLAQTRKWFWELETGPHISVFTVKQGSNRKRFISFIQNNL